MSIELTTPRAKAGEPAGVTPLWDRHQSTGLTLDSPHDISARRHDARERRRLAAIVEASEDAILSSTPDGIIESFNPAAERLYGYGAEEMIGCSVGLLQPSGDPSAGNGMRERLKAGAPVRNHETVERRKDGSLIDVSVTVSPLKDDRGDVVGMSAIVRDISQRKAAEEELRSYALHLKELSLQDPLTGLRNYRGFHATVDAELEHCRDEGDVLSVALLDVDGLKQVNDSRGRQEGDRVLRAVAEIIGTTRRPNDLAARVGGEEFGLVLPGADAAAAELIAAAAADSVAALGDHVTISYGVATWPEAGDTKELLLLRADMGLYAAKPAVEEPLASAPRGVLDGRAAGRIDRLLSQARNQLGVDLLCVGEFTEGDEALRLLSGDAASFGLDRGACLPLDETYCARMVDGRIGHVVPDARKDPETAGLDVTHQAGIGSYVGVPIHFSDGHLFGALCGLSHEPDPDLSERDVSLMRFLAGLVGEALEEDRARSIRERTGNELVGIHALLAALEARDQYTSEHSRNVVGLATGLARRLGLSAAQATEVEQIALLHDIGKVGIPDVVLQKTAPLDAAEWDLMRQHPVVGERILASTESLAHLASAVRAEHERWDGGGYPDGLLGDQTPLASRIVLACDAYDAMTSDRPYRAALRAAEARAELHRHAGTQFDPGVVEALLEFLIDEHPQPRPERPLRQQRAATS